MTALSDCRRGLPAAPRSLGFKLTNDYTTYTGVYSPSGDADRIHQTDRSVKEVDTSSAAGTGWRRVTAGQDPDRQPLH